MTHITFLYILIIFVVTFFYLNDKFNFYEFLIDLFVIFYKFYLRLSYNLLSFINSKKRLNDEK